MDASTSRTDITTQVLAHQQRETTLANQHFTDGLNSNNRREQVQRFMNGLVHAREAAGDERELQAVIGMGFQSPETNEAIYNQMVNLVKNDLINNRGFSLTKLDSHQVAEQIELFCREYARESSTMQAQALQEESSLMASLSAGLVASGPLRIKYNQFIDKIVRENMSAKQQRSHHSSMQSEQQKRTDRLAAKWRARTVETFVEALSKETFIERISKLADELTADREPASQPANLNAAWMQKDKKPEKQPKKPSKKKGKQRLVAEKKSAQAEIAGPSSSVDRTALLTSTVHKYKNQLLSRQAPQELHRVTRKWEPIEIVQLRRSVQGDYNSCSDEELLYERNKHYIRVEKIFADPKDKVAYTFKTKTGLGLFGILENNGKEAYGVLYYGINDQGQIYHRYFCPKTAEEMKAPLLKNPSQEEHSQAENQEWIQLKTSRGFTVEVNANGEITQTYEPGKGGHKFTALPIHFEKAALYEMLKIQGLLKQSV